MYSTVLSFRACFPVAFFKILFFLDPKNFFKEINKSLKEDRQVIYIYIYNSNLYIVNIYIFL